MATKTANNLLFAQAFNTQYNIWSNIITRRSLVRLLLGVEYLDFFKKMNLHSLLCSSLSASQMLVSKTFAAYCTWVFYLFSN